MHLRVSEGAFLLEKDMHKIEGTTITLTRGDSFATEVGIKRIDEETGEKTDYKPVEGDQIRFAMKHKEMKSDGSDYKDEDPLLVKQIPYDTMILKLEPSDTKELDFGKYAYDLEIVMADGWTDTFLEGTFIVAKEVY